MVCTFRYHGLFKQLQSSVITDHKVYSNNFNQGADSAWSSQLWTSTSSGLITHNFLGAWDDFSTTLTLTGLETHQVVNFSFDLYVIGSVYGNFDPAIWSVSAGDSNNPAAFSFATTFSNIAGYSQAYPSSFPEGINPAQTGSVAINPFSSGMPNGVTAYHLDFTFQHTTPDLSITFAGNGFLPYNGPTYGRWGLDNVEVAINAVPEPSNLPLFLLGLAILTGITSRNMGMPVGASPFRGNDG